MYVDFVEYKDQKCTIERVEGCNFEKLKWDKGISDITRIIGTMNDIKIGICISI